VSLDSADVFIDSVTLAAKSAAYLRQAGEKRMAEKQALRMYNPRKFRDTHANEREMSK
jgi:hypothetical protein